MKVVVPLTEGFEEIEFNAIVDILRRADIDVTTAGLREGLIEGAHKVKVMADTSIDKIIPNDFDAIVLPGGYPGFVKLGEDKRVLKLVQEMDKAGKYVSAICGAPAVFAKAGILKGRKATIHPAVKEQLTDAQFVEERVVVDGKLITSQAPGTVIEFVLKIVELLAGEDKMKKIKADMLA